MVEGSKTRKIKINREIIEAVAIDAINIFTREVLKPKNFLNEGFDKFFDEEFDISKYEVAKSISTKYEEVELTEE